MSIDEVMDRADLYRIAFDTDLADDRYQVLRAAIKQHVSEEVAKERDKCAKVCDDIRAHRPTTGAGGLIAEECATAIRDRAEKEEK